MTSAKKCLVKKKKKTLAQHVVVQPRIFVKMVFRSILIETDFEELEIKSTYAKGHWIWRKIDGMSFQVNNTSIPFFWLVKITFTCPYILDALFNRNLVLNLTTSIIELS